MLAGIDAARRIVPFIAGIALMIAIGLGAWWLHHSGYQSGADDKDLEWSAKWDKQSEQLAKAKAKATMDAREEEQRRQASIDKVRDDAEKQIARAESDALAARDAADGVLEQAKRLAARAGKCPSNPSTTQPGAPTTEPVWCSPTCSAGLTRERGSWQQLMTAQEPQD